MALKEKLDSIWNKPGVIHACHINVWKWGDGEYWWDGKIGAMKKVISCVKGRRHGQLGPKPKGKGFSFLSKGYYALWSSAQSKAIALASCHCAQPHHLPVWWCPVHGEVTVPMD